MFSERQLAARVLESYLGLIRSEAVVLAAAMTRDELREVVEAPQSLEPLVVIGKLVPLLVRVELRAAGESETAVCEVIDRGQERMATATRQISKGATCAERRDQCAGAG